MTRHAVAIILGLAVLISCYDQASQTESPQRSTSSRRVNKAATSDASKSVDDTVTVDVAEPHEHDDAPIDITEKEKSQETLAQTPSPMNPPPAPASTPAAQSTVVEFKIKAGTGNGPWNDAATAINLKVGQSLKITNEDTVDHLLHTGGAPFPHARNPIKPGSSVTFQVSKAFAGPMLYDHITAGKVFIVAAP